MQENHGPDSEGKPAEVNPPAPGPVAPGQRLAAVDVLRGFALLGILVLNIEFFALPKGIYFDPRIAGGFTGLDLLAWKGSYVLFLEKFMSIFSMLFGAGLVLMSGRLETAGRSVRGIYYRRLLWLLLFGLAHGYLLWYGDVLYSYAVAGLLLFPLRRKSPRFLAIAGILVLALGGLMQTGSGLFFEEMRRQAAVLEDVRAGGKPLTPSQEGLLAGWTELAAQFKEPPEKATREIRAYRGGYGGIVRFRAPVTLMMQTQAMIFLVLWRALGLIRVYTKAPGKPAERERPFTLRAGEQTVADAARLVHRDMARTLKFARVWGASVAADGQHVGREHRLAEGDVLELHA